MNNALEFHVFTVGWEPSIIKDLAIPIKRRIGFKFTCGLVGDSEGLPIIQKSLSEICFVSLSKKKGDPLPEPDYELLASLESDGIPTIRSMIQGDRVLRNRTPRESLGYATLLARHMKAILIELKPDVILSSFDNLHASLSLAVAKSLGVPWVSMAFTAIPANLTGFCKKMNPESLVPLLRSYDSLIQHQAEEVFLCVRSNCQPVLAKQPSDSFKKKIQQLITYGRNFLDRIIKNKEKAIDRFTYPTVYERIRDIFRRSWNSLCMPKRQMLNAPPNNDYVFFPLHMQPESTVDSWAVFYQDQLALIKQLILAVPVNIQLVVKLHYSDPDNYNRRQLIQLMQIPGLKIAHPNSSSHFFLQKASLVFGIQGTACLEAALLGKPVIIFGTSPYLHFPITELAKKPDELHQQICRMLNLPTPSDSIILEAFICYIKRYMPGRINNWKKTISEDELSRLSDCFLRLCSYLKTDEYKKNWYK